MGINVPSIVRREKDKKTSPWEYFLEGVKVLQAGFGIAQDVSSIKTAMKQRDQIDEMLAAQKRKDSGIGYEAAKTAGVPSKFEVQQRGALVAGQGPLDIGDERVDYLDVENADGVPKVTLTSGILTPRKDETKELDEQSKRLTIEQKRLGIEAKTQGMTKQEIEFATVDKDYVELNRNAENFLTKQKEILALVKEHPDELGAIMGPLMGQILGSGLSSSQNPGTIQSIADKIVDSAVSVAATEPQKKLLMSMRRLVTDYAFAVTGAQRSFAEIQQLAKNLPSLVNKRGDFIVLMEDHIGQTERVVASYAKRQLDLNKVYGHTSNTQEILIREGVLSDYLPPPPSLSGVSIPKGGGAATTKTQTQEKQKKAPSGGMIAGGLDTANDLDLWFKNAVK